MRDPDDPLAEIRAGFYVECEELLEETLDGLQSLQDGSADAETINSVFRAVHSIKGGAGAFGLEDLVAFAHRYETALDEVRSGRFTPDDDTIGLFFGCSDLLTDLVLAARDSKKVDPERIEATLMQLRDKVGGADTAEIPADAFEAVALSIDLDLPNAVTTGNPTPVYSIRFVPDDDLYRLGNEPLFLFRALAALGELEILPDTRTIPGIEQFIPGKSYAAWKLLLRTDAPEAEIREVFEFVERLCSLHISTAAPPVTGPDCATADLSRGSRAAPPSLGTADDPAVPDPGFAPPSSSPEPAARATATTVRVDLERIDLLVNLVGELVINQAMLSQSVAAVGAPPNSAVLHDLEEFRQLTRNIQDSVMMIRAQPVRPLFQRMSRIAREASADVGKTVRLRTDGDSTEVDRTVIERLADPLTHMIRNAVDHGIEMPEDRIAAGKPAEGLVRLSAAHRSGRVVIEISDDGGGIDREQVYDNAISQGLITPGAQLSVGDIDNLLFLPGFTTASEISSLSGRGVGMDVVRSAIQALGGRIVINSVPGAGTTFSISVPLTLAMLDGLVVQVAGETLVVPLTAIVETLTLTAPDIRALGLESHVVLVRGQFVPLLDLGTELGYRDPPPNYVGGIALLIAQENGDRAALLVDAIHEQRQVVIKALHDSYGRVPGVAAATILGDGQIALILDPVDIAAHASSRPVQAAPSLSFSG